MPYIAPSVKKAFEILKTISTTKEGVGISELARDLKMPKSTVHGMVSALEDVGAITRDPSTKRFALGSTLFELGRLAYSQLDLKDIARPFMEDLMERTQCSVFLGILNREHVTIVEIIESRADLKITSPIGATIPLLAGAVGKVFLSEMGEEQALKVIKGKGLTSYTEKSIIDPQHYLDELARVRREGYATDDEEYIPGVRAVASPIKGSGHMLSAIWVVGFRASLDEEKMKILVVETRRAAESISNTARRLSVSHPKKS